MKNEHADELELLEKVEHKPPCKRAELQFSNNGSRRMMNLSELIADKGKCVWCDAQLKGRQQRWCSSDCVAAAQFKSNPQSPAGKMYRLIMLQSFACVKCGLSFEQEIRKRIRYLFERENKPGALIFRDGKLIRRTEGDPPSLVRFYHVGDNTGHLHQTDHIVPIHKGGAGIDPNNLQVICVPCHKEKTKRDNSKWK